MANWYETNPQLAQQTLAQIEQAAGRPLTPQEIEQAKTALAGEQLDPKALKGVLSYAQQNLAPNAGTGSGVDPTAAAAKGKVALANQLNPTAQDTAGTLRRAVAAARAPTRNRQL